MARPAYIRRWLVIVTLGAALATGCTSNGDPPPTNAAPTSGTPGTSTTVRTTTTAPTTNQPTTSPPTTAPGPTGIPAAAQEDSIEGSVAFVRFLVTEVNRAYRTPSAAVLDPYFASSCIGCQDLRNHVAKMEALRQRTTADTWFVTLALPDTHSPGAATIELQAEQHQVDFVDQEGRRVDHMVEARGKFLLTLRFTDRAWQVIRWQKL